MLKQRYLPLVLSGRKRITIRRRVDLKEGDEFFIHSGGKIWGRGRILKIERIMKSQISPEHARLEGMDYDELRKELDRLYGRRDIPLYVIHFEVVETFPQPRDPERDIYGDLSPREVAELALREGLFSDDPEARRILERLVAIGSIRAVAQELGGLHRRRKVRAILRRAVEELREKGIT